MTDKKKKKGKLLQDKKGYSCKYSHRAGEVTCSLERGKKKKGTREGFMEKVAFQLGPEIKISVSQKRFAFQSQKEFEEAPPTTLTRQHLLQNSTKGSEEGGKSWIPSRTLLLLDLQKGFGVQVIGGILDLKIRPSSHP